MRQRRSDSSPHAELVRVVHRVRRRWRLRLALRGASLLISVSLLAFGLAALGLSRIEASPMVLVLTRGILALLALGIGLRFLVLPLLQRVTDDRVALYIEEHEPSLQAALLSALHSESTGKAISPALMRRTMEEAVARCRKIDYGRTIERSALRRSAALGGGSLVAGALLFLVTPIPVTETARLLFLPAPSPPPATSVALDVTPGDIEVPRGADQKISLSPLGFAPREAQIAVRTAEDSTFLRMPMLASRTGFEITLFDVDGPTEYFVEADGVRSRIFSIAVTEVPYVQRLGLELLYPSYTGLPSRTIEDGGDVAAPRGTRVRLAAVPTRAVQSGSVRFDDGRTVPLQVDSGGTLRGEFQVEQSGYYHIELLPSQGESVEGSPQYLIDVLEDAAPTIAFSTPGRDLQVTSVDEVFLEATAHDDFGVAGVELIYSLNGQPERRVPLHQGEPTRELSAGHTLFLEELQLQPGDFISYYARARDNRSGKHQGTSTSDLYFLEIRPFGREYRQAEQGGGGGGGMGGGALGSGGVDGELSQRQREIIAATFNVIRDREQYSAQEYREHLSTIATEQERLREQTETLAQRLRNRGSIRDSAFQTIAELLPRAAAEMSEATAHLGARSPSDAMPAEQRALQLLQRAETVFREVQVGQGSQSEAGGGGRSTAEDLADLFGLELDKLRNQYETVQRSERAATQRELDQTIDRLQELARRQQQENENLRRALSRQQSAGSDGSSQRELAEDTEQAARELERLARSQSRPELQQAARRLQQAAEAMRRAAASGQNGNAAEASAALEELQEVRRRLQRQRSSGLEEGIRDARRRVERLQNEQREVARQMQEISGSEERRGRQAQQLGERKERQADEVENLQRHLDRLAAEARQENPDAARELREAANSLREDRLAERIRQSRLGTRSGASPEYVQRMEDRISAGLQEVGQKLGSASEALGRSGPARKEEQLEAARRLAQGVESLQEQTKAARERSGSPQQPAENGQASGEQPPGAPRSEPGGSPGVQNRPSSGGTLTPQAGSQQAGERNLAPEEIQQIRGEARQRLEQARELRDRLASEGYDIKELDRIMADLRALDERRVYADWEELAHLQTALLDRVKRFEFNLRQELRAASNEQVFLSGAGEVPPEYREMVAEYYRSLARQKQP